MNLNFKPYVRKEFRDSNVVVTAPSPVTDRMWEILHNTDAINDPGCFEMERKCQTQFLFKPNPGFETLAFNSVIIAGTYLAVVYTTLEEFWKTSWHDHFLRIDEVIELSYGTDTLRCDEEIFNIVVAAWIAEKSSSVLKSLRSEKIDGKGVNNPDYTTSKINKALALRKNLQDSKPKKWAFFFALRKPEKLKKIDSKIEALRIIHKHLVELAPKTNEIYQKVDALIEEFKNAVSKIPDDSLIHESWNFTLSQIEKFSEDLKLIRREFSKIDSSEALLKEISEIASLN